MTLPLGLRIGEGTLRPDFDEHVLFLEIPDVQDTYTIPYIQSCRDLEISADFRDPDISEITLSLSGPGGMVEERLLKRGMESMVFRGLAPGEYALGAATEDRGGNLRGEFQCGRIGVGTVFAALGDSITEGYYGECFDKTGNLSAGDFPPEAVSRDGRNFPQFGPTTSQHMSGPRCMQSWMTDLNNLLSEGLARPVFIANEGWGGYRTSTYLNLMREDRNWQRRMALLRPDVWLIHLGVNDERGRRGAGEVAADLEAIIDLLMDRHGAKPEAIFLAKPCYDYAEGAEAILSSYCRVIDDLIARRGLSCGPDFFDAYSRDKQRYYGGDPVHPNIEGMKRMAELWSEAILRRLGKWEGKRT